MINFTWHECKMLDTEFLESNPVYLTMPTDSDETFQIYFTALRNLAEQNIPIAHSVNTSTSAKACLFSSTNPPHWEFANRTCPASFSVVKEYDTLNIRMDTKLVNGSKAWVSTLATGEFGIFKFIGECKGLQSPHFLLEYTYKGTENFVEEYKNVCGPGMFQSGTGEFYLKDYTVEPVFHLFASDPVKALPLNKALALMVPTILYGGCIRLVNELEIKTAELNKLTNDWQRIVDSGLTFNLSKDYKALDEQISDFYYKVKQLLADLCGTIIQNSLVKFYNPETELGKYFYDSMVYSTHKNSNLFR
jgi:hypothetical protein